jgi:hypothetical protein
MKCDGPEQGSRRRLNEALSCCRVDPGFLGSCAITLVEVHDTEWSFWDSFRPGSVEMLG